MSGRTWTLSSEVTRIRYEGRNGCALIIHDKYTKRPNMPPSFPNLLLWYNRLLKLLSWNKVLYWQILSLNLHTMGESLHVLWLLLYRAGWSYVSLDIVLPCRRASIIAITITQVHKVTIYSYNLCIYVCVNGIRSISEKKWFSGK